VCRQDTPADTEELLKAAELISEEFQTMDLIGEPFALAHAGREKATVNALRRNDFSWIFMGIENI